MRIVRFACLLGLLTGVSIYGFDRAYAQASPDVEQACTPDAMRLCSEFIPDVPKITACMKAKHAQLSSACLVAMRGGKRELKRVTRHEGETRHEARHHEARHEARYHRGQQHCDAYTHLCGR